jgi:hypothetical protein
VDIEFEKVEERVGYEVDCAIDLWSGGLGIVVLGKTHWREVVYRYLFRRQRRARVAVQSHCRLGKECIVAALEHL